MQRRGLAETARGSTARAVSSPGCACTISDRVGLPTDLPRAESLFLLAPLRPALYFIRSGFKCRAQSNHCPLQLLDSPAVRHKLYSELGLHLPRAPICHELWAIQPQALDEELTFGGETDDTPIVAFVQVLRQIVLPGMEQTDMRRIVFVPVRALVLVASRTTVDEILFLIGATMCARAIVVDRQRGPDGILVNPAVGAACAKAFPDLCAELLGHGNRAVSEPEPDRAP